MCPETINILFGLTGTIIAGMIGYLSAIRMANITTRKTAGAHRSAFAPAIAKYPLVKHHTELNDLLWAELSRQAIAIEEFRHYVPRKRHAAYQEAWENYHKPQGAGGSVYLTEYVMGEQKAELFKSRIHAILQFTE